MREELRRETLRRAILQAQRRLCTSQEATPVSEASRLRPILGYLREPRALDEARQPYGFTGNPPGRIAEP